MPKQPSLLFVHGAFSNAAHCEPWMRYFEAAGFHCLAVSLPGHEPSDPLALARLSLNDYAAALERVRSTLPEPPILIGHSMGGLLVQQLAATGPCAAIMCLASAPPWVLVPQFRALPYLVPLLPHILAGRPIRPSAATLRYLALHDLPRAEQDELVGTLGFESGRAFRSIILGTMRVKASAVRCPALFVSGGEDRFVSLALARSVAAHYGADHQVHANRGHWLLARTGLELVARPVLEWLEQRNLRPGRAAA